MKKIETENFNPSMEPVGDKTHRIVRAAIGALPVLSGTALELLNSLIEDPFQSRRTEWLTALSNAINEMQPDLEKIKDDTKKHNAILSSIIQSTDVAIKTGDKEIHSALINVVLNNIASQDSDEELTSIYLHTIRQLTSSHFALLNLIKERQRYEHGSELVRFEEAFFSEIASCDRISKKIPSPRLLSDLVSMQLIYSHPGSPSSLGGTNYCTMELSEFATNFLKFIGKS